MQKFKLHSSVVLAAILFLCAVSCQAQNKKIGSKKMKKTTTGNGMNIQISIEFF